MFMKGLEQRIQHRIGPEMSAEIRRVRKGQHHGTLGSSRSGGGSLNSAKYLKKVLQANLYV